MLCNTTGHCNTLTTLYFRSKCRAATTTPTSTHNHNAKSPSKEVTDKGRYYAEGYKGLQGWQISKHQKSGNTLQGGLHHAFQKAKRHQASPGSTSWERSPDSSAGGGHCAAVSAVRQLGLTTKACLCQGCCLPFARPRKAKTTRQALDFTIPELPSYPCMPDS